MGAGKAPGSNAERVIDGGGLDAALSAPGTRMISLLITVHYLEMEISFGSLLFRMAEIAGEKFLWFGSKTETVSCKAGLSMGDAKLTKALLPGDILILRNSWRGWISFSNNKLKSDVPLVLCSRSSFVECCARQLHFHTVDSALKIKLASRHNLQSAVFPSFDFFNARFCASSLSSLLIWRSVLSLSLQFCNSANSRSLSFSPWLNFRRYTCHLVLALIFPGVEPT